MRWFCLVSLVLPFIFYFLQPQEGFRDLNHSHRRVITVGRTGLNGVSESAGSAPPSVTSLLGVAPPPTHRDVTTSVIAVWLRFQFIIFIRTSQQIFHFAFFYRNQYAYSSSKRLSEQSLAFTVRSPTLEPQLVFCLQLCKTLLKGQNE